VILATLVATRQHTPLTRKQKTEGSPEVKIVLASIVAAIVLAVGAVFILDVSQRPAYDVYASPSGTRVGDPGHNLVGQNWSGNNTGGTAAH
jgi:hypothetical protein